ncbi:probable disease resistance protein At4g27220 [Rhodamnia argentea]|uniref:Probable disease resistance protein At4g27220 n=1 Tax=Rhodamnia argentea TaxID=178133 RepID=A0ABM3HG69_9MYRT|nr:probable disease resistance protein At4g27220 [Rhodamnia argentea]
MSIDPAIPVASFAWDVLKWVVVPVKRQFGYVISSKSYAQDLWKEVGKLTYEAERIHNAVEVARNNIRTVYSLVTDWHESAEKALNEARELLEEFEKASKSCCYGTLPDPNCRYQFSRKAKDKIELLQRLARECSEFRDISSIDPAPGNVTAVSAPSAKDDGVFESRASIKRKIMAALADNRNSVVGVYGMGGIGKSTLLEEVERKIREERVIGCKLLLTSRDRDVLQAEMGCDDPLLLGELQEEEARRLFQSYVGDKVCDEEFKPLVEKALHKCAGLPFLIVQMAKLLKHANLSGWKNVLKQLKLSKNEGIGEKVNKMLQLSYDHLKGEDVKSLLRLCVVCGVSKPSLENLVRYGVGLGLFREDKSMEEARESLASSIRTLQDSSLLLEDGDVHGFKIHDLVREFVASVASRDNPFLVLKEKDRLITEWSKDKLKSCRATCFPYVDMEELPEEIDCPEMQMFLLFMNNKPLDVPDSYFNSMRKLAVLNLTGIHLIHSPLSFQLLENLHTLCPDGRSIEDVASLGNLKGLQILSFANSKIHRLPKEIGQLVELRLLDLNHCSRLQVIEPGVLGSLIKLEELYLENSFHQWNAMEQTPPKSRIGGTWHSSSEYKTSTALKLKLNPANDILHKGCVRTILDKTDDLYLDGLNKPKSICELSLEGFPKLKHLHVENGPSIHYILQWPSSTAFKRLESLVLEDLINMEKICHSHISSTSFRTLKKVRVKRCFKMEVLFPCSLLRELPQLEKIGVIECDLMREIGEADEGGKVELRNLRALELRDLPGIKNFLSTGSAPSSSSSENQAATQAVFFNGQQVSIPSLQTLTMSGLPNLETIWSEESAVELSNLQSLELLGCKSLSKVFNFRSLVNSHKLHTLTIENCVSVQEVFDLDGPSASGNVETPSELTTLELRVLPSLRLIWSKNPCGIVGFHRLTKLKVVGCGSLRFLFLASMVKSLAQLRELSVHGCKKMEAIIMEEEGLETETSGILEFPTFTRS